MARAPQGHSNYYEYRLKDIVVSGCDVDAEAKDQALILKFAAIERLNYEGSEVANPLPTPTLAALDPGGRSKAFVIHWLAIAGDVRTINVRR